MTAAVAAVPAEVIRPFPGLPAALHDVREFVRLVLAGHPLIDDAELCTSELAANAVAYTRSGLPGGTFAVAVQTAPGAVVIRVRDQGSALVPEITGAPYGFTEHGRGLRLVDALAAEWGSHREGAGRVVWCRLAPLGGA